VGSNVLGKSRSWDKKKIVLELANRNGQKKLKTKTKDIPNNGDREGSTSTKGESVRVING